MSRATYKVYVVHSLIGNVTVVVILALSHALLKCLRSGTESKEPIERRFTGESEQVLKRTDCNK